MENRKQFLIDTRNVLIFVALLALFLMLARMARAVEKTTTICTSGGGTVACQTW